MLRATFNLDFLPRPPIAKLPIEGNQDFLSRELRALDNKDIIYPPKLSVGVYITTNESNTDKIARVLLNKDFVAQGVHIGFSGWHNLDIMAIRRSARGIICDHNPENALFLQLTFNAIKTCINRNDFIHEMLQIVRSHDLNKLRERKNDLSYSIEFSENFKLMDKFCGPEVEIKHHLHEADGWLASEERYKFIRNLVQRDKIVLITEDLLNTETFLKMQKLLQEHGLKVDTLYLSNILEYMKSKEEQVKALNTIHVLSSNDTLIIDAKEQHQSPKNGSLIQRVASLQSFQTAEKENFWWFGKNELKSEEKLAISAPSLFKFFANVRKIPEEIELKRKLLGCGLNN